MRIIAGKFRGRRLLHPEGDVTRPITDRVKQSLFDILTPVIAGARVYDCFAGTGSMGLESLSRGAAHVTFFDADKPAVKRLRRNIDTLKVAGSTVVVPGDLFEWFNTQPQRSPGERVDIIFLDPPYRFLAERPAELMRLAERMAERHLAADGAVVFRHDAKDALALPALTRYDERGYGSMTLEFLKPAAPVATPT